MNALLVLLRLLPSSAAVAAPVSSVCEPLPELHERIRFCDQNEDYTPPSQSCKDRYQRDIQARLPVLRRRLLEEASTGTDGSQALKLGTAGTVYGSTDDELAALIARGEKVLAEIDAYAEDFVPPIPSRAPGYFHPNPKDPRDRARKPEFSCYAKPMAAIDQIREAVEKLLGELKGTQAEVRALHGDSGARQIALGAAPDGGNVASRAAAAGSAGARAGSTISGELTRRKDLEVGVAPIPLARAGAGAGASAAGGAVARGGAGDGAGASARTTELGRLFPAQPPSFERRPANAKFGTPDSPATTADLIGEVLFKPLPGSTALANREAPAIPVAMTQPASTPIASTDASSGAAVEAEAIDESLASETLAGHDLFVRTHIAYERLQRRKEFCAWPEPSCAPEMNPIQ